MVDSACDTGAQDPLWCPTTTDQVIHAVVGLLPSGRAWDAASVPDTVMNQYWRGFAGVLAWTYMRLCQYIAELFCYSLSESYDQWAVEYGIGDDCDPFGFNLCAKVTALGGADCGTFVRICADNGFVITCNDVEYDVPLCGIFECGETELGATPVYLHSYDFIQKLGGNYLDTPSDAIVIPVNALYVVAPVMIPIPTDSTGHYEFGWGQAYQWDVTVDLAASRALADSGIDLDDPISNAGNFLTGCTPLCDNFPVFEICFLDKIKPSYTTLTTTLVDG